MPIFNEQYIFEQFLSNSTEITFYGDHEYVHQMTSQTYAKCHGLNQTDIVGTTLIDIFGKDEFQKNIKNQYDRCLNGETTHHTCWITFKNGQRKYLNIKYFPCLTRNMEIQGVIFCGQDETRSKVLEDRLRQVEKLEAIGTLAGGIAHDFNNILASIQINAEMALEDVKKTSETFYSLQQIMEGSIRAKKLIEQILKFTRDSETKQKPVKIGLIVKETLKMLRSMLSSTIRISQKIDDDAGTIMGNPTQIQQLIINLCNNAAHALGENGGQLIVGLKSINIENISEYQGIRPGAFVKMTVTDTGHGIATEIKDKIFDPFFTTKDESKGTGIGLFVVKSIVKGHRGFISADSSPGDGAEFTILLPKINDAVKQENRSEKFIPMGNNEDILFIDDEKVMVDVGKRMLQRLGYKVIGFTTSQDAFEAFCKQPDRFKLVITDMTMPFFTGIELSKKIRHIRNDIPIILCTGYNEFITKEKLEELGISKLLMKPFQTLEMAEAIHSAIYNNQT